MRNKTTMTSKQLEAILKQHAIDKGYWPEMKALVFYGKRPGADLLRRLHRVANYVECFNSILTELSKPLMHRFPPADWQPACRKAS